jgi:hypothetical protein
MPQTLSWPDDAIEWLDSVVDRDGSIDVVMPLDDRAVWLVDSALAETVSVAGARGDQADLALNKIRQIEIARSSGFAVPETVILGAGECFKFTEFLPGIVKPAHALSITAGGIEKGDVRYVMDVHDVALTQAFLSESRQPFLYQPLIAGVGEGVFGFALEGRVVAWSGHRRLRMMNPHGSGSSACLPLMPTEEMRAKVECFVRLANWRGPFMIELLRDASGQQWFMELNGRMWGSLALSRRSGFDYPAWAVRALQEPRFVPPDVVSVAPDVPMRHLGRDLLHLLFVLRGPKTVFHKAGWPNFWTSAAGVLRPADLQNFYNYNARNRTYFLMDAIHTIRSALR